MVTRNEQIADLRAHGFTLAWIGAQYGISVTRVQQIVRKVEGDRRRAARNATLDEANRSVRYDHSHIGIDSVTVYVPPEKVG